MQEALGEDKLLIGKIANQSYVKAVQIEFFTASNDSIENLLLGAEAGQVVQAHVPVRVPCTSDLTDYIAAFLEIMHTLDVVNGWPKETIPVHSHGVQSMTSL